MSSERLAVFASGGRRSSQRCFATSRPTIRRSSSTGRQSSKPARSSTRRRSLGGLRPGGDSKRKPRLRPSRPFRPRARRLLELRHAARPPIPAVIEGSTPDERVAFLAHWYPIARERVVQRMSDPVRREALSGAGRTTQSGGVDGCRRSDVWSAAGVRGAGAALARADTPPAEVGSKPSPPRPTPQPRAGDVDDSDVAESVAPPAPARAAPPGE